MAHLVVFWEPFEMLREEARLPEELTLPNGATSGSSSVCREPGALG